MQITSTTTRVTTLTILAQKRLEEQQKTAAKATQPPAGEAVTKLLNWSPNQPSEASEVLEKLKQAVTQSKNERKGMARDRLEQIKKQLQMLRSFGADPKTIAKIAKQLAQELKAAAKDYGDAVKEGGSPGDAAAGATGADIAAATSALPSATPDKDATRDPEAERQAANERLNSEIAKSDARFYAKQADRDVLEEFRSVASEIRSFLKQAVNALRKAKGNDSESEDLLKAAKEMDKAVQDLAEALDQKKDDVEDRPDALLTNGSEAYSVTAIAVSVEVVQQVSITA